MCQYNNFRYTKSIKVYANGILIARQTDPTVSHINPPSPPCAPAHVANVNVGSPNVFVHGKAVARIGDSTDAGGNKWKW